MAVKASATITLSFMVDVKAVYRYYKLQASTASAPSVPTTATPSGWDDTEPTYTEGSTQTLYTVDKTVFTNDEFVYSLVSKSTAYEAAKTAYNKAVAAKDTADDAKDAVDNMEIGGRNLILKTEFSNNDVPKSYYKKNLITRTDDGLKYTGNGTNSDGFGFDLYEEGCLDGSDIYTLTFTYRTNSNGIGSIYIIQKTSPNVTLYNSSDTETISGSPQIVNSETEWKQFRWTFRRPNISIRVCTKLLLPYLKSAWFEIKDKTLKLEKGNKPTAWTPAPEDVRTEIETKVTEVSTELTQTSEEIRMDFNTAISTTSSDLQSRIQSGSDAANQKFNEINKYIRFVDGKILLGETGNELMLTIQNDRVSFTQSDVEVAYFSNNNLYIKRAEVLTTLKVGNYEFTPRNNGGLALRKRSE